MQTITNRLAFIRKCFGATTLARNGVDVAVNCPSCGKGSEKKKLSISLNDWKCHCWVCGLKGKNLYFILKKHVSVSLADEFNNKFSDKKIVEDNKEKEIVAEIPDNYRLLVDMTIRPDPDVRGCISYLKKRGIGEKELWFYKIGTCINGKFRRRIIIPSFDTDGNFNYFCSRSIDKNRLKYINCKVDKRGIIFNEIHIDWSRELTIVEGVFDLFKSNLNSTCILGSTLNENFLLFRKIVANKTPVLLALDPDAKDKAHKIAKNLREYCCDVRMLDFKKGDVGDMTRDEFENFRQTAHKTSWNDFMMKKISSIKSGSII